MKFWELISSFRSEEEILTSILDKPQWTEYKKKYNISKKDEVEHKREILDIVVPFELLKEICGISKQKFYLYYKNQPQIITSFKRTKKNIYEVISPLDILIRYGGQYIEEVLEKGSSDVNPRSIRNDVEVLGAYNITKVGMVAILRTERNKLESGEVVYSINEGTKWQVIYEPLIRMSSYEKQKSQREQGIRNYLIKPLNTVEKPKETEILKRKPNR